MITTKNYEDYLEAKAKLNFWKKKENELRVSILEDMEDPAIQKGTVKKQHLGFSVKATYKLNESIDEAVLDRLMGELNDEEKDCLKFKPSLIQKNINKLDNKSKLFSCITSKPGLGSIVVEVLEK